MLKEINVQNAEWSLKPQIIKDLGSQFRIIPVCIINVNV